ncbi:MAG: pyridoxamine 5'-phosphate oxidase family protein [Holophaga sp.]|nr:pyridoxamine 5'-phosphate oxidase family protein [Holophaga sp.]
MVFATSNEEGEPNAVYVKCVNFYGDDAILIADNKFYKTRQNILTGNAKGSLLFLCPENKAYQIKGRLEYHTEGEAFQAMLAWTPDRFARNAAVLLRVEACFCGAEEIE